jgi:hypothetical protein
MRSDAAAAPALRPPRDTVVILGAGDARWLV